jgi:polar amino acid transport system substrate-binding protein
MPTIIINSVKVFLFSFLFLATTTTGIIHSIAEENTQPETNINNEPKTIKVATKITPPLVITSDKGYEGFSIELLEEITTRLDLKSEFVQKETVPELLDSVINKETDISISAISQTAEREKQVDFSQPYLDAGLQVVVRAKEVPLKEQVVAFLKSDAMKFIYFGMLVILVLAHMRYFYRRIRKFEGSGNYFLDIWDGTWWLFNGFFLTDFGQHEHRFHQFISCVMIIISIIFVTQFQGMVTADLTLDQLDNSITSIEDLKGKEVGVVGGTTAEQFAKNNQLQVTALKDNDELFETLKNSEINVLITDAPIAKYRVNQAPADTFKESIVLNIEQYAVAFPLSSPLRKEFNQAILEMEQDGTMAELNQKWFGE